MEELLNCIYEICCGRQEAAAALAEMYRRSECRTPEDYARVTLEYATLSPRSFVETKKEVARLAKQQS